MSIPRMAMDPVKFTFGKTAKNERWNKFSCNAPVPSGYTPKSVRIDAALENGRGVYGAELPIAWSGSSAGAWIVLQRC
jgi:hypothetical protein